MATRPSPTAFPEMDFLLSVEQRIFLAVNQLVGRNEPFDSFMFLILEMSLLKQALLVAILWGLWFRPGDQDIGGRIVLVKAGIGLVGAVATGRLLENCLPPRPRPVNADLPGIRFPAGFGPDRFAAPPDWSSLPSDNAIVAFALAMAIHSRQRALGWFAFIWSMLFICLPRFYMGRHYLGDLVAGAVLGTAFVALSIRLKALKPASIVALRVEHQWPGIFYSIAFLASYQLATLFVDARRILAAFGRAGELLGLK